MSLISLPTFVSTLQPRWMYWVKCVISVAGSEAWFAEVHTRKPQEGVGQLSHEGLLVAPVQNVCLFSRTSHSDSSIYIRRHTNRPLESVSM